jgi:hypothetical protein
MAGAATEHMVCCDVQVTASGGATAHCEPTALHKCFHPDLVSKLCHLHCHHSCCQNLFRASCKAGNRQCAKQVGTPVQDTQSIPRRLAGAPGERGHRRGGAGDHHAAAAQLPRAGGAHQVWHFGVLAQPDPRLRTSAALHCLSALAALALPCVQDSASGKGVLQT